MNIGPQLIGSISYEPTESYAVISDTVGTLLFYAGRRSIFYADDEVMYTSFYAYGNYDVAQGQLIVPRPRETHMYDVFMLETPPDSSVSELEKPRCIHMAVDMSANGGLGAVVGDETPFGYNLTERLAGTPHANDTDYWVLMHEWLNDKFVAYKLGEDGLDTIPVVSQAGAYHTSSYGPCPIRMNRHGEMKFSYQGDAVALTSKNLTCGNVPLIPSIVQLFYFDDATGGVSYWLNLPGHYQSYGIEFSQDGSRLYVPGLDSLEQYVDQYDLLASDTTAIQGSRTRVYADSFPGDIGWNTVRKPNAMELAPNGKIYVSHSGNSLDVIEFPNLLGSACAYSVDGFPLPDLHLWFAHTNQMKRYHDSVYDEQHTGLFGAKAAAEFKVWPIPADGQIWVSVPWGSGLWSLSLLDLNGRLVKRLGGLRAGTQPLAVGDLSAGAYIARLAGAGGEVFRTRLVVE